MKISFPRFLIAAFLMSFTVTSFAKEAQWMTDYVKALELAKSENKAILLDFTGSDWCGWCMRMKEETLDTPAFKHYAQKNLVLVELDFPRKKIQADKEKQQNQQLKNQFQIRGYPAFVLLDKDGNELGRQGGYLEGGPSAFIAKLNTFYKPSEANSSSGGKDNFDSFFKKPAQNPTP
jgi:protein disulfide-isomerase